MNDSNPSEATPKNMFLASVERCLASDRFIPTFYERFTGASEEIKFKFRHTDFEKQYVRLKNALLMCAKATANEPGAIADLAERARTHDRDHLNIKPELYDIWLTLIVATARDFDPEWNPATEAAWKLILGHAVTYMSNRY